LHTFTDRFNDGYFPSVIVTSPTELKSVGIFQAGIFFFWRARSVCKTVGKCFFVFPTEIPTEWGITDEGKAGGRIPSVMTSVKKSPTNF
jgi:hypothetical protein